MNATVYNHFKIDKVTRFCVVGVLSLINSYFIFMGTKYFLVNCTVLNILFAIIGMGLSILIIYYIPEWIENKYPVWGNRTYKVLMPQFLLYLFISFMVIATSPKIRISSYIDWITQSDNLKEVK